MYPAVINRRAEGILGQVADGSWRSAGVREQVLWQENYKESVDQLWKNGCWSARFLEQAYFQTVIHGKSFIRRLILAYKT